MVREGISEKAAFKGTSQKGEGIAMWIVPGRAFQAEEIGTTAALGERRLSILKLREEAKQHQQRRRERKCL